MKVMIIRIIIISNVNNSDSRTVLVPTHSPQIKPKNPKAPNPGIPKP